MLDALHVQPEIPFDPDEVGLKVTTMSFEATILPVTWITPVVELIAIASALVVDTKPLWQLSRLVQPLDETNSVTQVRAPEAAKMTSEAFARLV